MWETWDTRNKVIFEDCLLSAPMMLCRAAAMALASPPQFHAEALTPNHVLRWTPSPLSTLKINVDVAVKLSSLVVFGFVTRDTSGKVMASG